MNIKVLDCTLRDGGYINDWDFKDSQIAKILSSLKNSRIDVVECGYLNDKISNSKDTTLFSSTKDVDKFLDIFEDDVQKVVMINHGDYHIKKLPNKDKTKIDGIRLAFHKEKLNTAINEAQQIIALGYKLYFQPMVTKNYSDLEFLSMIEKINKLMPYAFYIVDSFGSMTLDEFNKYLILADSNLNLDISLGYHSHNNMQLAFSNAVSMCGMNLKREIIIDASIYGIGRGAGNLNTELIADFLNKSHKKDYDTLPLLEIIDELLSALMKKIPWGFSPAQFLSASYNCHPNYATYLINKNTNHIVGIKKILGKIPNEKKASFDKELIENLYIEFVLQANSSLKNQLALDKSKNILLIASGKSVNNNKNIINAKINNDKYISIALNHTPKEQTDFYFFTNKKRFDEFSEKVDLNRTVITNNISTDLDVLAVLDFKSLAFTNDKLVTNVAAVMLNYLISCGINEVEIAGLDGYEPTLDNYNYDETAFITDQKALLEENESLREALQSLQNKIKINYVTPSIYKRSMDLNIIGVIPARYKSTRFKGKPLCMIKNTPMIKRVYNQARKSKLLDKLVVATDNEEIQKYCESESIPVVMTSEDCLTGTDRLYEVSEIEHYDLYVNIQGDEPVIDPKSIDEVVADFKKHGDKYIAYNLYKKINDKHEVNSSTIIKVIVNESDELVYMSRLAAPFNKSGNNIVYNKQVCVYGYTKDALKIFSSKPKTLNEKHEDIEILRFIDMGYKVKMKETDVDSIAVDIPDDVLKVEKYLDINGLD
jgi:3-deoxy-D-manno-octulosonate cytidylyltransferase